MDPPTQPNAESPPVHQQMIQNMGRALEEAQNKILQLESALSYVMNNEEKSRKLNKPYTFTGKQNIESWITHVGNYLSGIPDDKALPIAMSYLGGSAHEWWLAQSRNGLVVTTLEELFKHLTERFTVINKEKLARDKLHRWREIKDISTYNEDFLKIVLDIPNISMEEQIDRYTRGMKPYIWRELCTKEYSTLLEAMKDAERVESAYKRSNTGSKLNKRNGQGNHGNQGNSGRQGPVPMDIGNIKIQKLTPEERERCRKYGLCFRCRQPGHMARDKRCPKNVSRN